MVLKRQTNFKRMMFGFAAFSNFFLYQTFMTGIYNYRSRELLNMRRVPLPVKLVITSAIACGMSYSLYLDHLYDEETYRVALKFRDQFQKIDSNEREAV